MSYITEEPIETRIGNYLIYTDVTDTGDLQIRVYPVDSEGLSWDHPFDTLDVSAEDVAKAGAAC